MAVIGRWSDAIDALIPAFCFNRVKEVRQDNVSTYHEMQYLEQLMDMVDTAKGTCARHVMLSRS
jgi:hypothetical protein